MSNNFLLDPKVDFVFKNLFCFDQDREILKAFVGSILGEECISELEVLNLEEEKHYLDDKFSRMDILLKTSKGEKVKLEIKLDNLFNLVNRSLYSLSKNYECEVKEKEDCSALKRTVTISLINEKFFENNKFYNGFRFKNIETEEELTDLLELHFIEIPKVLESDEDSLLRGFVEFLNNPTSKKTLEYSEKFKEIERTREILEKLSLDIKQREFYELREKMMKDKAIALDKTEKRALEKGLEKGKEIGIEEGREAGERLAKMEIAKKLLDVLDDWTISVKTGLDIETIKVMRKEEV